MDVTGLSLRLRVFLFFALIVVLAGAAIGGGAWAAAERIGEGALPHLVLTSGGAWFVIALATLWVWQRFDENVARPIDRLSHELERESTSTAARAGVDTEAARYLGALGPAIERAARALGSERKATGDAVSRATERAELGKARLEAVLRDLNQAVVICDSDLRILLYNHEAVRLLGVPEETGLGRPLSTLVLDQPIQHGLERLATRVREGRHLSHPDGLSIATLTATAAGGRTLSGRIALIGLDAGAESTGEGGTDIARGFIVTFADATRMIEAETERDRLIARTIRALSRPVSALSAIGQIVETDAPGDAGTRARFDQAVIREARAAADAFGGLVLGQRALTSGAWPMADVFSSTLFACLGGRLGWQVPPATEGKAHWLHGESFTLVELLAHVVERLGQDAEGVALTAERRGAHVFVDILWSGAPITQSRLETLLEEPLEEALGALTGRDVLTRHQTEFWSDLAPDGRARLRLPLAPAIHDHAGAPAIPLPKRPEFYDFDLMNRSLPKDVADLPLRALNYVVFDTETTGLNPGQGDQIVQVAGLRIVNGRLLRGEAFDELVDPGRPIPAASTRIHGISDDMVAGKPGAAVVLRRFHAFCRDAVLIAHNAAFDMRFLSLKQGEAGVTFDHPVLDTVLLSAFISDQGADHTLDALAERFGVTLPAEDRHTALGDSIATGAVFLRMLDLLAARGVKTLAEAQEASDRMVALRRRQNY